jgi:hypothetical protein
MKIEEIRVADFYNEPGQADQFRAMIEIRREGVGHSFIWVELTDQEIEVVNHLAEMIEQRLWANPPELPELRRV